MKEKSNDKEVAISEDDIRLIRIIKDIRGRKNDIYITENSDGSYRVTEHKVKRAM